MLNILYAIIYEKINGKIYVKYDFYDRKYENMCKTYVRICVKSIKIYM